MENNYFSLNRKLFDNEIWFGEPFTRGQAWIDLIGNANYKQGSFFIRGNEVIIKRGQIGWSEVTMAKRWQWGRNKVRGFLKLLENRQQIVQQKDRYITTIITICNYDRYQNDTADDTADRQQKDSRQNITNKDNKNKIKINKELVVKKTYQPPNLKEEDFIEIANKYKTPLDFVKFQYDKMVTWAESKPNNPKLIGRNWKMTLMTFVREDALKVKQDYERQNTSSDISL